MPPRRRGRGARGQKINITTVKTRRLHVLTLSGVTGNSTLGVAPRAGTAFTGLGEVAEGFDLFRCKALRYRLLPMDPTDTTAQVAAYVPDIDVQTQTNVALSENPYACCQSTFCGVPTRWVHVPRAVLKGMIDWYKCIPDAGAAEFESQGLIIVAGGLSDVATLEVEGVFQFKNPVSDTLQFERTIERAVKAGLVVRIPTKQPV